MTTVRGSVRSRISRQLAGVTVHQYGSGQSVRHSGSTATVARARAVVDLYTDGSADPRLDLRPTCGMTLPPRLIQVGDAQFLTADSIELADRLDRAGARCELQVWPDQMHVFHALAALIPESRSAYRAAALFITTNLDRAATLAV